MTARLLVTDDDPDIVGLVTDYLDFRDQGTSGHSRPVSELTTGIARELGIAGEELLQIRQGALLHDLGKLKIPDNILWKPAPLTDDEWRVMRRHAEFGFEFPDNVRSLRDAAEIVYSHHEKFDGSGYLRGLKGEAIPVGARVFAMVDALDAMIYPRPYHKPITFSEAIMEIRRCARSHFDPSLIDAAVKYLSRTFQEEAHGRIYGN